MQTILENTLYRFLITNYLSNAMGLTLSYIEKETNMKYMKDPPMK